MRRGLIFGIHCPGSCTDPYLTHAADRLLLKIRNEKLGPLQGMSRVGLWKGAGWASACIIPPYSMQMSGLRAKSHPVLPDNEPELSYVKILST